MGSEVSTKVGIPVPVLRAHAHTQYQGTRTRYKAGNVHRREPVRPVRSINASSSPFVEKNSSSSGVPLPLINAVRVGGGRGGEGSVAACAFRVYDGGREVQVQG